MAGIVCMFCNRTLGEHSHDTRDVCNFFLPVDDLRPTMRAGESDKGGARKIGVAPSDAQGQADLRTIATVTDSNGDRNNG